MSNQINFRIALPSDKDQILRLLNKVFGSQQRSSIQRDDKFWNWKFRRNPFGESLLSVAEKDGEIIAFDNLWPWEFRCRGEILKALQPCDSVVHESFRRQGIFKELRLHGLRNARQQDFDMAFNFPNSNSLPGNRALGAAYLGRIKWWVKVMKPLNILKGKWITKETDPYVLDTKYELDIDILDLLVQESISFDRHIRLNRVKGFFEWRYQNHPTRNYGMYVYEQGSEKNAVIFTINQKGLNREMVVTDIVGSKGNTLSLLRNLAVEAKVMNVDFIAIMDNTYIGTDELWKAGFIPKKFKNMVVTPFRIDLNNVVTSFEKWSLVAGLHDSI